MTPTRIASPLPQVVFVCHHGSAKSVVAAAQFRNLVAALGYMADVNAMGTEPDAAFPPHVLAGLQKDGLTTQEPAPQLATEASLQNANLAVTFGPDVAALLPSHCRVRVWGDVPNVSDGYGTASAEIYKRVALLVDELLQTDTPQSG